jgi:hypothetical protein
MIAKRVHSNGRRSYGALARYCRDADHAGEKCLMSWQAGCWAEEYDLAIAEIEATQEMNSRAKSHKTYHLIISFRPEDEARLMPDAFKEIEEHCATALGLSEHQRVCGVHKNTNNLHLHVAYNLIHPEKLTMATSLKGDFFKLSEACRSMEKKFDLLLDNGMEARGDKRVAQRAEAMEAHSGELSFQGWLLERKETILDEIGKATSWREAHRILSARGIEIKEQGNGLVLANASGKETMKASSLDRSLSKSKLVARFGAFAKPGKEPGETQARPDPPQAEQGAKYDKKPIQPKSPERDRLWQEFQALVAQRKAEIEAEKMRNKAAFGELKMQWARGRAKGARLSMMLHIQKQDVAKAKAENQKRMAAIRDKFPYHNWNGFLQYRVEKGDQTQAKAALKVLRSREGKTTASQAPKYIPDVKLSPSARIERLQIRERQRIAAEAQDRPLFSGCKQRIDNRGVIIITLASGGTVRDAGTKIHFSQDRDATEAATLYALAKFGKRGKQEGTTITKLNGKRPNNKPHIGILRECTRNGLRQVSELTLVSHHKKQDSGLFLPDNAQSDMER